MDVFFCPIFEAYVRRFGGRFTTMFMMILVGSVTVQSPFLSVKPNYSCWSNPNFAWINMIKTTETAAFPGQKRWRCSIVWALHSSFGQEMKEFLLSTDMPEDLLPLSAVE